MKKLIVVAALAILGSTGSAIAGDAAAGKAKYSTCVGCHGATGAGNAAAGYPALSGKDAAFVAKQLTEFKSGARVSPVMGAMVAGLSPADIENLAAYIATLK